MIGMLCITTYLDYLNYWKKLKDKAPLYIAYTEVRCKFCNSKNIIKYGRFKNMRRWWCKDCQRKFADNNAFPGMRTPTNQIASAMHMYYDGLSLEAIRKRLEQDYGSYPSHSTIHEWITRFTSMAVGEASNYLPKVGDTWIVYGTPHKIFGEKCWLIDILDSETQFLLASKLFDESNFVDIECVLESAKDRAQKTPDKLLVDGYAGNGEGIEGTYLLDGKHITKKPFNKRSKTLENWRISLNERYEILRSLKDKKTAQLILAGWSIHYNFFRPHSALAARTPAKKSGISANIGLSRMIPMNHQDINT